MPWPGENKAWKFMVVPPQSLIQKGSTGIVLSHADVLRIAFSDPKRTENPTSFRKIGSATRIIRNKRLIFKGLRHCAIIRATDDEGEISLLLGLPATVRRRSFHPGLGVVITRRRELSLLYCSSEEPHDIVSNGRRPLRATKRARWAYHDLARQPAPYRPVRLQCC